MSALQNIRKHSRLLLLVVGVGLIAMIWMFSKPENSGNSTNPLRPVGEVLGEKFYGGFIRSPLAYTNHRKNISDIDFEEPRTPDNVDPQKEHCRRLYLDRGVLRVGLRSAQRFST